MSVHQIIYTSCMRGINGVNDGQQIFSYDAQFNDSNNDSIKSLFSYQPPALEPGVVMSEEIAATFPQSFIFRKLENGKCALTLSTYLGRDYMGSAGRFGNHLSHVVVADEGDFVHYPCEFYGSSLLREHMEFEEVNNPNPPDFLPTPVLEKGYTVDVDTVLEFLSIGNRLEIYKNMLYAMLAFERERKRVVICDEPENIIMWIAALEYAVPLKMALNINFTTYEFDPSLSVSQICGVSEKGTRYTTESKELHFVFDICQNKCIEFEKEPEFYDFIDTAFSLSFESIQDFHAFLMKGYNYEKVDEDVYSAYALYSLLSDGINGITKKRLESAIGFAQKYANYEERVRIANILLSQYKDIMETEKRVFLAVMQYVLSTINTLDSAEQMMAKCVIVDRTLSEFLNPEISEDSFVVFYNDTDKLCKQYEFRLATELMQDKNREKLFAVMQSGVRTWKIAFIIRVISTYAKESHIPISELSPDKPLGNTYYGIIMAIYSQNPQNGFFLVTCILNEFANECYYLTNMALHVEGMLLGLPYGERETEALWKYYGQTMASNQANNFSEAYNILAGYERYEQIFMLFQIQMKEASDVKVSKRVFDGHFNEFVRKNRAYASMYGQKVLSIYFDKLCEFDKELTRSAKIELFDLLVSFRVDTEFSDVLIRDLLKNVPYGSPSKQNSRFIQNAFQYIYNFKRQPVTGKLLLLLIGMIVDGFNNHNQVKEKMEQLEVLTQNGCADLTKLSEKSVGDYFGWVLPTACEFCQKNYEMKMLYELFDMSSAVEKEFFAECTKLYLKQCKDDKDYSVFAEYFGFICENSNRQMREELGKALCKLNKNKIAALDETIRETFHAERQFIRYWEDVKETAETTNPLLNNISNLFRRRKKED